MAGISVIEQHVEPRANWAEPDMLSNLEQCRRFTSAIIQLAIRADDSTRESAQCAVLDVLRQLVSNLRALVAGSSFNPDYRGGLEALECALLAQYGSQRQSMLDELEKRVAVIEQGGLAESIEPLNLLARLWVDELALIPDGRNAALTSPLWT